MNRFINKINRKLVFRQFVLIVLDSIIINLVSAFALLARFNSIQAIPEYYLDVMAFFCIPQTVITLFVFFVFRFYHSLWRYASIDELVNIVIGCFFSTILNFIVLVLFEKSLPRSYWVLFFVFLVFLVGGMRFFYRVLRSTKNRHMSGSDKRIIIVGAGEAGNAIVKEIQNSSHLEGKIIGLIDDDPGKNGRFVQGIRVLGNRNDILAVVDKYSVTDIIIAIPSAPKAVQKEILAICQDSNCNLKILPGIYQLINEEVSISTLRNVEIEDLLGRDSVELDTQGIAQGIRGKTVLITGGGGSIGSELCRQIANYQPEKLIIVDIYENSVYDIQQELLRQHPSLNLVVLIASVRNEERIRTIFRTYQPHIVYHAAAHKHVPLMESSPHEAIKNNVFGTWNLVKAADDYRCERFVLISTDKAVNPTNIMGASKRICEMIIQTYDQKSQTDFVAVRFGNVLGSNGSVIPLFKKQILSGGPVTVTHPDIIRYFMTIPEAVSLVIQAGSMAKGGEIFVLDMGEPVKIVDLAKNLIRLSGFAPNKDIMIEFTGLRPGEKLYEELLMSEEGLSDTSNKLIHIGKPMEFDADLFEQSIQQLFQIAYDEEADIREEVAKIVSTYNYQRV